MRTHVSTCASKRECTNTLKSAEVGVPKGMKNAQVIRQGQRSFNYADSRMQHPPPSSGIKYDVLRTIPRRRWQAARCQWPTSTHNERLETNHKTYPALRGKGQMGQVHLSLSKPFSHHLRDIQVAGSSLGSKHINISQLSPPLPPPPVTSLIEYRTQ